MKTQMCVCSKVYLRSMPFPLLCLQTTFCRKHPERLPRRIVGKELTCQAKTQEAQLQSPGRGDPWEDEISTHSSVLAWKTPWTEEPGGLQSVGSQRAGRHWACVQFLGVHAGCGDGLADARLISLWGGNWGLEAIGMHFSVEMGH